MSHTDDAMTNKPPRDLFAEAALSWADGEDETGWRPQPGSLLIGVVDLIDVRSTEYGPAPVIVVRTDAGLRIAVWAFHAVLRNALARARPQAGDRIAIKRLSDEASGAYQRYRVAVESSRPEARAFDWDDMDGKRKTDKRKDAGDSPAGAGDDDDLPF